MAYILLILIAWLVVMPQWLSIVITVFSLCGFAIEIIKLIADKGNLDE